MGKGEIARNEQFLLFPLCFQKACFPGASKGVNVWQWVNSKVFTTQPRLLANLAYGGSLLKTFWEKKKMLLTNIFSFFPQCFLPFPKRISIFDTHLSCLNANALNFDWSNILSFGKELKKKKEY